MSAAEAIRAARGAGIRMHVDGVDLVLEASAPPPAAVVDLLTRHKADLIVLLRTGHQGWSSEDWLALYDERAGIAKLDGRLPRSEAEVRAFECCVAEWLNLKFEPSPPGNCIACGGCESAGHPLLPHGIEPTGHAWLHSHCWPAWHAGRKAEAVAVLKGRGLNTGAKGYDEEHDKEG